MFGLLSSLTERRFTPEPLPVKYTKNKLNFRVVFFKFVPVCGVKKSSAYFFFLCLFFLSLFLRL